MKRSYSFLFLLLALLSVLSASCGAPRAGSRLVYGLTLSPSGIDPHVNASSELGIPLIEAGFHAKALRASMGAAVEAPPMLALTGPKFESMTPWA